MAATIIDGKAYSDGLREKLKADVADFVEKNGFAPGLAVILVGDDPASHVYVRNKERASTDVGINSRVVRLPADITEEELNAKIDALNADEKIHGLMVQCPLPPHLDEKEVTNRVLAIKDVDGLTTQSAGNLLAGVEGLVSCTPAGVIALIKSTGEPIEGKHAVVVGRSNLVGKPVSVLLLEENATVTICHSRTKDLRAVTSQADILVAATGQPESLDASYIKEGAIVIDVGTTKVGKKLKGDVLFDDAKEKAGYLTPVPGGVGPMTITMLLTNTVKAAKMQVEACN